jgi:hypothetical protein
MGQFKCKYKSVYKVFNLLETTTNMKNGVKGVHVVIMMMLLQIVAAGVNVAEADEISPSTSPTSSPPTLPPSPFATPFLSPLDETCAHVKCAEECDLFCFYPGLFPKMAYMECVRSCMDRCAQRFRLPTVPSDILTLGCPKFLTNIFEHGMKFSLK